MQHIRICFWENDLHNIGFSVTVVYTTQDFVCGVLFTMPYSSFSFRRQIPVHKQRIAGKSIPIEKFAIAKSERCLNENAVLPLPALVGINTKICSMQLFHSTLPVCGRQLT